MTNLQKKAAAQARLFNLPALKGKSLTVSFTGRDVSSDGGLLLLQQCERQTCIIDAISACLTDNRHSSCVETLLQGDALPAGIPDRRGL